MTTSRLAVTIEPVVSADLAAIAELEKESFSDPWSLKSFQAVIGELHVYMGAARESDSSAIVGYVVAWFAADQGEIANIAVAASVQRRGIGAALLDAAITEGRFRGATRIFLEVRESNEAARALYASRGFGEIGRRKGYYRHPQEDAIVLMYQL